MRVRRGHSEHHLRHQHPGDGQRAIADADTFLLLTQTASIVQPGGQQLVSELRTQPGVECTFPAADYLEVLAWERSACSLIARARSTFVTRVV